jgi:hypothetical protein
MRVTIEEMNVFWVDQLNIIDKFIGISCVLDLIKLMCYINNTDMNQMRLTNLIRRNIELEEIVEAQ